MVGLSYCTDLGTATTPDADQGDQGDLTLARGPEVARADDSSIGRGSSSGI